MTLTATLRHRRGLLLYGIEDVIEDFQAKISTLRTDAFSPIRTSVVGKFLQKTYEEAMGEYGMFLQLSGSLLSLSFTFYAFYPSIPLVRYKDE